MPESRLIRDLRTRQETADIDAQVDLFADVFLDLLVEALKRPDIRTAVYNIVAAAQKSASRATTAVPGRGGARRG